ncbi:MAG: putative rane protein [Herbinix sp.]|jgi:hypothetical protein|nr:putative rane protein [Herbinix sp.]
MQRRSSIHISSLIVFLSILTTLLQFAVYYFFASSYLILGISSLFVALCCHILLERSYDYEACFIYTVLSVFISLIVTILTYLGKDDSFSIIPYTETLIGIVVVNWLIPNIHCFIRNMFDYGTRIENYTEFYRNSSIIFLLFYIGIIVYGSFFVKVFPWAYPMNTDSVNLIPFLSVSTQIEDYLYGALPLSDILLYLSSRILIFIPYGFYVTLISRRVSRLLRCVILLFVPVILEALQYFLYPTRCDIDDVIYAFFGGLLGILCFSLTNAVYKLISGRNFLSKDPTYRFTNSSLHF